jgi:hypothetical protein
MLHSFTAAPTGPGPQRSWGGETAAGNTPRQIIARASTRRRSINGTPRPFGPTRGSQPGTHNGRRALDHRGQFQAAKRAISKRPAQQATTPSLLLYFNYMAHFDFRRQLQAVLDAGFYRKIFQKRHLRLTASPAPRSGWTLANLRRLR